MAGRNAAEIAIGAVVLVVAAGFLGFAVASSGRSVGSGYPLKARFDSIAGLGVGADVRLAGVKVGTVTATDIDPRTYQAVVTMNVRNDIHLPTDSSAEIETEGLLGGDYLGLTPGGAAKMIPVGGQITVTQGSVSLEQLLGKFIFSVTDLVNTVKKAGNLTPGGSHQDNPGGPLAPVPAKGSTGAPTSP